MLPDLGAALVRLLPTTGSTVVLASRKAAFQRVRMRCQSCLLPVEVLTHEGRPCLDGLRARSGTRRCLVAESGSDA